MRLFLVVAVCFIAANADSALEKWAEFKLTHGKTYKSLLEEKRRFAIFQENLNIIDQHNEKFEKGESSFKMGATKFADLTRDEFKSKLGYVSPRKHGVKMDTFVSSGVSVDKNIDYVKGGLVTPVKDQGSCGSCWAFSVAGCIEGQVAKEKKILKSLSAQNLLDCVTESNEGCDGGDTAGAFDYVQEHGILNDEDDHYRGIQKKCTKQGGWKTTNVTQVAATPEAALEALATVGPLSMAIDATDLQFYFFGIIDGRGFCKDKEEALNHGVLLVGAGTEGGHDYFLVKNSWGYFWGQGGYFKIRTNNACGSLLDNLYAKLQE